MTTDGRIATTPQPDLSPSAARQAIRALDDEVLSLRHELNTLDPEIFDITAQIKGAESRAKEGDPFDPAWMRRAQVARQIRQRRRLEIQGRLAEINLLRKSYLRFLTPNDPIFGTDEDARMFQHARTAVLFNIATAAKAFYLLRDVNKAGALRDALDELDSLCPQWEEG